MNEIALEFHTKYFHHGQLAVASVAINATVFLATEWALAALGYPGYLPFVTVVVLVDAGLAAVLSQLMPGGNQRTFFLRLGVLLLGTVPFTALWWRIATLPERER